MWRRTSIVWTYCLPLHRYVSVQKQLRSVKELYLEGGAAKTTIDLSFLRECKKIHRLGLTKMNITGPENWLSICPAPDVLIKHSQCRSLGPNLPLPMLQELYVGFCPALTDWGALAGARNLRQLQLYGVSANLEVLSACPALDDLTCGDMVCPANIGQLSALQKLTLHGCTFSNTVASQTLLVCAITGWDTWVLPAFECPRLSSFELSYTSVVRIAPLPERVYNHCDWITTLSYCMCPVSRETCKSCRSVIARNYLGRHVSIYLFLSIAPWRTRQPVSASAHR